MSAPPLLEVQNVSVAYGAAPALHDLSLQVERGEAYGLVGESGSGKSTLAMAVVRYLAAGGRVTEGDIRFDGQSVLALDDSALRAFRGRRAAVVYQNPAAALNPSMRVGDQVAEVFVAHAGASGADARTRAIGALHQVHLEESFYSRFPHQLSGGMQQRIVIAIALAARPDLLILDEPTTGLDATVEAAILRLVAELRRELGVTVLLISHNLGVVAAVCDRVGVLYAGRLVEEGPVGEVFGSPAHPYTRGLLASLPGGHARGAALQAVPGAPISAATRIGGCMFAPRCELARPACLGEEPPLLRVDALRASRCYFWEEVLGAQPVEGETSGPPGVKGGSAPFEIPRRDETLLRAEGVRKRFRVAGGHVDAVDGVSLDIPAGVTVGLVGESGSGKSTFARVIAGLDALDSGTLRWRAQALQRSVGKRSRSILRELQMVFQDPDSTLNPRHTIRTLLERSIQRLTNLTPAERRQRAADLLQAVDLEARYLAYRPGELSGGQRQRVAIARAFAGSPSLVLCDEPTSALDASVQATILNLLTRLQHEQGSAYLFISHDIDVVRYMADIVGVLYFGRLMQLGNAANVFEGPQHPYTEVLLAASVRGPLHAPAVEESTGARPTRGCPFQRSCPRKLGTVCETEAPPWRQTDDGGGILCHIPLDQLEAHA